MIFDKEAHRFMIKDEILSGKLSSDPEDISTYIDKTASDVVKYLVEHGIKIAVAESCTGGILAGAIESVPGASEIFECGIVSYSERIKSQLLGLPMELIDDCGVVSETVALAMAQGVRLVSHADIGVGITGIAGPTGGSKEQPVGTVYVSVIYKEQSFTQNLRLYELGELSRRQIRLITCAYALEAICDAVKG